VTRIQVSCSPGERRIAVLGQDGLEDYAIWRPGAPDGLGDIHVGRVISYVPAMAGAFVELQDAIGFLPDSQGAAQASLGDAVTVRVTRSAHCGKGPRLAVEAATTGTAPGLVRRGPSPLHRLAAVHAEAEILVDDSAVFAALRADFEARLRLVHRAFDDTLESAIEALAEAWTDLPGGVRAGFFPSPALTAIDMDGAATTALRGAKAAIQFAANREALPGLARQIRLRNISGAILVDFAGLPSKRRQALGPLMEAAFAGDPLRPRLLGFTRLGLAEILRPRAGPPLHEVLAGPHAAGLAGLREAAAALRATPMRRLVLHAAQGVVAALDRDRDALDDLARLATYGVTLRSDPSLRPCAWRVEDTARA
jgi:Ribonuclease G/E